MNGADSRELIRYFKEKSGKYLKLDNGKKVKLFAVVDCQWTLTLSFIYDNKVLHLPFTELYGDYVTMRIPEGLEEGCYMSPIVKFGSLQSIGYAIEKILTNWTEREDEIIELNSDIDLEWE